ncbi:MAG: cadmium-translocating P-type ATPase [Quinella sp. 2Q5]|nr:cadmium-translocating P-type ATPase [Quinella sp. 2Q5]
MTPKQRRNLIRIVTAAALLIGLNFVDVGGVGKILLYLVPYAVVGYDIVLKAIHGLKNRRPLDESLLMTIATVGAFALAIHDGGDCNEAVAVMLFYQIGEWFQSYAVGRSRKNIAALMDIRPDYANIESDDGLEQVDPDDVEIGSVIVVQPGEKIPIDGVVVEGSSALNTVALTGESLPREVGVDSEVVSGCINLNGVIKIRTTKDFGESTASKILELVEDASSRKSKSEDFIARFARIYTPAVVICAATLAIVPALIVGDWGTWIYRALIFLVISCPCALVISIPLSFFAGIGGASRDGILIKGSNFLETLANVTTVVMDKTGTLTRGSFEVDAVHSKHLDFDEEKLLHLAAHVERYSTHPIANSLRKAYPNERDDCTVSDVEEIAGRGIKATVNGQIVCVGNEKFMDDIGAEWKSCYKVGTVIHVAVDGLYAGHIVISDTVKKNSAAAVRELNASGANVVMLTGDSEQIAANVAGELGIADYRSELLPADKVTEFERILATSKGTTAFVGDGINDAPVLSRADVGIAMGALGSDAAIEAADVVLMDDDPLKISRAIKISRRCLAIVKQNIFFAIGVKILCLILGAGGLANMWAAIFADVGVMILAVLNAIRCLVAPK